jgi:hypothetical protein
MSANDIKWISFAVNLRWFFEVMTDCISRNIFVSYYEQEKETAVVCQMGHLVEQEEKSKVLPFVVLYLIDPIKVCVLEVPVFCFTKENLNKEPKIGV